MQSVPLHSRHETIQLFNPAPSRKYTRSLHLLLVAHQGGGVNSKSMQGLVYILVLRYNYYHIVVFDANVSPERVVSNNPMYVVLLYFIV